MSCTRKLQELDRAWPEPRSPEACPLSMPSSGGELIKNSRAVHVGTADSAGEAHTDGLGPNKRAPF